MADAQAILRQLAARYVWWKTPEEALREPRRVMAQVMNLGDFDDAQALFDAVGRDAFREALALSDAGEFNARSWHYWHYRLGLAELDGVPPLPARRVA